MPTDISSSGHRYRTLLRVLDRIRHDAPTPNQSRYLPPESDIEKINQARARAFIHLYLKVMFGITEFAQRERTITDSSGDGGIDGYYIDSETKTIHLLQSKFRTTEKNFESKEILLEDLLSMDINRILEGETKDENGIPYNGKIYQLQREVSSIPDVARFSYKVVVLANLTGVTSAKLRQLTGGYAADLFDFEKTYEKLVFPVITGTYFAASDIVIPIDLSNKNAGSKISYNVKTKFSDCEITVLFVPTLEIAKLMHKYKNAILKFNPRSFLDLEGQSVNAAIRDTILKTDSNEFALFNNGITMLSEETNINEKIGQKNKAQLRIKNPQIINGGQTSFTLSRLYIEHLGDAEHIFSDKEVLLKIITLLDNNSPTVKLNLIDEISNATNKQTPVINADRYANEAFHIAVQKMMFERFGLLYERKRGEFSDGIRDGYVASDEVIERNHFWRLYYAANGNINRGFQKKLFQQNKFTDVNVDDTTTFDRLYLAVHVFRQLKDEMKPNVRIPKVTYARIFAYVQLFLHQGLNTSPGVIDQNLAQIALRWQEFIEHIKTKPGPGRNRFIDKATGEPTFAFNQTKYYNGHTFQSDVADFFSPT